MELSVEKKIIPGFGLVFLILVFLGIYSYTNNNQLVEASDQIIHTHNVLYHTERVVSLIADAEATLRGYVITGDTKYLTSYNSLISKIPSHINGLSQLTQDNTNQQLRLSQLNKYTHEKIAFMGEVLRLRKTKGFEASENLISTGEGERVMGSIRQIIESLKEEEKKLLSERINAHTARVGKFYSALLFLMVFITLVLASVFFIVYYNFKLRNKAEKNLQESEAVLQSIIDNTSTLIYIKDLAGVYLLANKQFQKVVLKGKTDFFGKTDFDFYSPEVANHILETDAQVKRTERLQEVEERIILNDGIHTYISVKFPLRDSSGTMYGIGTIATNISERKASSQALLELSRNLESANKELEAFTYSVSHDLRAPLRSIDGYTRILYEDYYEKLDEEGKRTMDIVMRNARKMGQLIDDLLAFSRIGRADLIRTEASMDKMLEGIILEIKQQNKHREVEVQVNALPVVCIDSSLMHQVWYNLVSNAVKYSSTRSKSHIEIGSTFQNDANVFYIRDNGVGFDMKYVNKLFGVFQRLHKVNEFEGTGVGLAIVKRVVNKHGGEVWAEGKLNEGAVFYFSLPVSND